MSRRRIHAVLVATLAALAAGTSNAQAASVGFDALAQTITYAAAPGEANALALTESAGVLTLTDTGMFGGVGVSVVDADGADGCSVDPVTPNTATCPTVGVSSIVVSLDDEEDSVAADPALALSLSLDGGPGNDQLIAALGTDRLIGGQGDDALSGGGGFDTADYSTAAAAVTVGLGPDIQDTGGAGSDTLADIENLVGSAAGDTLTGDAGVNVISGGDGADALAGGDGTDELSGGAGDDRIEGHGGNDSLDGGSDGDTLHGGAGDDALEGGDGVDTFSYAASTGPVTVDLALAGFQDTAGAGADALSGGENLIGSDNNDTLSGDAGANVLQAEGGHDLLTGGAGPDQLSGGPGDDTADYSTAAAAVTVGLGPGVQDTGGAGSDTLADIENLVGSTAGDTLTGDAGVNVISGGDGADTLAAGDGPDELSGGAGDDRIEGHGGNDSLDGGSDGDTLEGGAGDDALTGGGGFDTADYSTAAAAVTVGLGAGIQDTGGAGSDTFADIENLAGSAGGDTLTGDAGVNVISGGDGADTLAGGDGHDQLSGGAGDDGIEGDGGNDSLDGGSDEDTLQGGTGNDALEGGAGVDTLSYAASTGPVTVNLALAGYHDTVGAGADAISGGENLIGSDNNDTLTGDAGANAIRGDGGHDVLAGGAGPDQLVGGLGDDTADYSARTQNLSVSLDGLANDGAAGEGDAAAGDVENVVGGAGADLLSGDDRENRLNGGPGDDSLDGGQGVDALAGGAGFDRVSYAGRLAPITVDLSAPGADGERGERDAVSEIEGAVGGANSDRLVGGEGGEALDGGPGNDVLDGRGGNDLAVGGAGNDIIYSGEGDDRIDGASGGDLIRSGNGRDSVTGGPGDDVLEGGGGADVLGGGGGADTVDYSLRTARVRVSFDGQANDGELGESDRIATDVHSVRTGAGKDLINAVDGARGSVSCGQQEDAVRADTGDRVAGDCESLNGLSAKGRCRVARGPARVSRKGVVALRMTCVGANRGSVALDARVASRPGGRKRTLNLGRSAFFLGARPSGTVRVQVSKTARRALLRAGKRVRGRVVVTTRHRAGIRATRLTGAVVLKVR